MIKIGIIGFSEGNGHPYSWSAIFNGYNRERMNDCGYPVINDYLSKRILPEETIKGAKVTHIWSQDRELSIHTSLAANIDNVCNSLEELIDNVDAILLARDDWQSHIEIGLKVLKSSKPVYIDKPIAVDTKSLKELENAQQFEGQIFSCSALRYSHQVRLTDSEKQDLGKIRFINSSVPNSWEKYSVHLIDPIVSLFVNEQDEISHIDHNSNGEIHESRVIWDSGLITNFSTFGKLPAKLQFELIGEKASKTILWTDAFSCFKSALEVFTHQVMIKKYRNEMKHHYKVASIIEKGQK